MESSILMLRVPLLFTLRRDPYERAQHNSNTYNDWVMDRLFIGAYVNQATLKFLMTPKDYPPSQAPASFNLAAVRKKIEAMGGAK